MERVEMNEKTGERGGGNSGRCEKVCCFWEEESINRFTFEALFIFVWISRKCDGLQLSGHKYLDRPIVDITARVSMEGKREREREREREKESEREGQCGNGTEIFPQGIFERGRDDQPGINMSKVMSEE